MILTADFSWLESYLYSEGFWFEDVVNWENVLISFLSDLGPFSLFLNTSFANMHVSIDIQSKFALLDQILLLELLVKFGDKFFFDIFVLDFLNNMEIRFPLFIFFFFSDYQDLISLLVFYNPELLLALNTYIELFWTDSFFQTHIVSMYDFFPDCFYKIISEFLENIFLFFIFAWFVVITVHVCSLLNLIRHSNESFFNRFFFYISSMAHETRVQMDVLLQVFFLLLFYWSMALATLDDDREETLEFIDSLFFSFFLLIIFFLIFKYSIHYFSFLEASDASGRSTLFVVKQFFRDFMGSLGLFLRFFILVFRLNVYDNLDDLYDSYYIFLGDFEEEGFSTLETFFPFSSFFFFNIDERTDRVFPAEDDFDWWFDFFLVYFNFWGKFFLYLFFIVEELVRVALALYISYLIIFEVHAANCSYVETNYFVFCRSRFHENLNN